MSQMCRGLKNATENKYVFRCSLKVVSEYSVRRAAVMKQLPYRVKSQDRISMCLKDCLKS